MSAVGHSYPPRSMTPQNRPGTQTERHQKPVEAVSLQAGNMHMDSYNEGPKKGITVVANSHRLVEGPNDDPVLKELGDNEPIPVRIVAWIRRRRDSLDKGVHLISPEAHVVDG